MYKLKPSAASQKPTKASFNSALAEVYAGPPPPKDGKLIGVDCHPDSFTSAVFEGTTPHDARKVGSRENMELEDFLGWAKQRFTAKDLFLMEAGANSFEIHRRLEELGLRAEVLESAFVGKHAKDYADDDKMAAARIVLVYLGNKVPCVWVPDTRTLERRQLLHLYRMAVANDTAATNSLKSYLNQSTIRLKKRSVHQQETRDWIFGQRAWSPLQVQLLNEHFQSVDKEAAARKRLYLLICQEVSQDPLMLRMMNLMGVSIINAFALLATIGDVHRFSSPEKLVAYIGLNPGQKTSGEGKRVKLGIGRRGRRDMRNLLIQGAQSVLSRGGRTAIGKWGWKLFARKGHRNIAVGAIARKMLVQVWHLLIGNPPTNIESNKGLTAKLRKLLVDLGKVKRAEMALPGSLVECIDSLRERILAKPVSSASAGAA